MFPSSTHHEPVHGLWPAEDLFSDDALGGQQHADERLCQRTPGAPSGDHVRLVRILSARPNGPICCETCISSLEAPEPYSAVSYAWGSPLVHCPILLDGRQHLVTKNLWRFLNHAGRSGRNFPGSGWLWIDALSIDQRSLRERAYQVGIMAEIFTRAESVVVWLGPAYNNSGEAMKALSASVVQLQRVDAPALPWTNLAESAFVDLCERAYWRRIWVFQELRAGRNIHLMCGSDIIPCSTARSNLWRLFGDFLSDDSTGERLPRHDSAAEAVRRSPAWNMIKNVSLTNVNRVQTTLWTLLTSTRDLHCTDPRDRVYSLLSTATSGHQGIRADYTIPVQSLMNVILRNWHSYLRPSSLREVNRQCILLEDIFRVGRGSIYTLRGSVMPQTDYCLHHFRVTEWKLADYGDVKIWAEFYGHKEVCRLLGAATDATRISRNQDREEASQSRPPNTTATVRPQPSEPRPQVVARGSKCRTLLGKGLFSFLWSVDS